MIKKGILEGTMGPVDQALPPAQSMELRASGSTAITSIDLGSVPGFATQPIGIYVLDGLLVE